MSYSNADILAAFDHFSGNWGEVQKSSAVGCSFCLVRFEPGEVTALYKEEAGILYGRTLAAAVPTDTVRCPKCKLPYVLGDGAGLPVNEPGYLSAVHQHWHT